MIQLLPPLPPLLAPTTVPPHEVYPVVRLEESRIIGDHYGDQMNLKYWPKSSISRVRVGTRRNPVKGQLPKQVL